MAYISDVSIKDGPNLDAFSRLRVSVPHGIFDGQFTYNLLPLQFEAITNGSGATVTHDATNRSALMTFSSTPTGGKAFMQSYEYNRYEPGRSQVVFITFNFIETTANVIKFAGLSDGTNGFELQQSGTTVQLVIYSGTGNGTQTVAQASWNLDKLNGTGPSGLTLNLAKTQILVIDFQALYVGRVRFGFDIGGQIVYVHQFVHANLVDTPYIQYASLPVRCGMTCTGTVSTTMRFTCSAVMSENSQAAIGGIPNVITSSVTASDSTDLHALSIRPKTTYNSITNRTKYVLQDFEVLVTGNTSVQWKLVIGQAITGTTTFADVNTAYSSMEYNTAGTISGSAALVLDSGFASASSQNKGSIQTSITARTPITLDAAGAVRANGTLSVLVQGLGAASACRVAICWLELR